MDAQVMERGGRAESSSTEEEQYQALKRECHDAFIYVDQALTSDESGDVAKAVELYQRARHHLEKGFQIQCDRQEATKLRSKMTRSLAQVKARLEYLEPMMAPQQNGLTGPVESTAPPRESEPSAPATTRPVAPPTRPPPPSSVTPGAPSTSTQVDNDLPPAYSEVVPRGHISAGSTADERDFISLGDSILSEEEASGSSNVFTDADELLCIPDGVQIFYVSPDGHVSAPSYPGPLRVVKIPEQNTTFLQVSDWLYPLVPGQSPALHSNNGAYMFPDVLSGQYGSCVGVVISSEVDGVQQAQFQSLLQEYSQLHTQPPEAQAGVGEAGVGDLTQVVGARGTVPTAPPAEAPRRPEVAPRRPAVAPERPAVAPRRPEVAPQRPEVAPERPEESTANKEVPQWSQKVSKGLVVGAEWVSWGATKGAELTGKLVTKGTAKLKEHIRPDEKPAEVDPKYVKGAQVARATTHVTLKVTKAVVIAVRDLTLRVGRELAPHVKRVGTQLLPDSVKDDTDGKKKKTMDGVVEVAAGGLQAFSTVYIALEAAAVSIAKNIGNATVETVEHKYGTQAGRVADDAVNTVGNAGLAWHYMDDIGIKAILKRTAKDAGKAAIEDMRRNKGAGSGDPSGMRKGGPDGAGGGAAGGAAGGAMGNML
ncbi:SPG20 [Branchiostoma lanceolatum]|uniref:SPG20 protein n=1 Tax=Branchiostoma lanceolatum TaxID=7740 RepID=A0A8K0A314_BRALA|nr:SPG20 [Branchiostoma lanceolatum]